MTMIGAKFFAHDGHIYFCDSIDSNRGYWMTRVDAPLERRQDEDGPWRRNISERAIGRTFKRIG